MKTIAFEPLAGTSITGAALESCAIARQHRARVRFSFNGTVLEATPKKSPVTISWEFWSILGYRTAAHEQSREYRQRKEARRVEVSRNQATVNGMLEALPGILGRGDLEDVMIWLEQFTPLADDIGVQFDKAALVRAFETAGFVQDYGVGQPSSWFNTRTRTGYWVVGQVIASLRSGMPPHPVTVHFVEKFMATPI